MCLATVATAAASFFWCITGLLATAFSADEGLFFVATDAAMGVEAFEDELGGGGPLGIGFTNANSKFGRLLH